MLGIGRTAKVADATDAQGWKLWRCRGLIQRLAGIVLSRSKVRDNMKRSLHQNLPGSSFNQLMMWWSGSALFGFLKLFLARRSSLG
ncbi:hypothetical protein IGI04_023424 [Brassica rapa subsp. trilocularis]|uniref:Uncharacterized protein n=1 Tax=Brassica rapa subsp. trilocularis TaxID=1813537 RepID=A0ABQ7M674_BRACM|nr:hypothetical protein IGI04_023424 [Brassica rapa subsp. trilocularis]